MGGWGCRTRPSDQCLLRPGRKRRAAQPILSRRSTRRAPGACDQLVVRGFGGPPRYTQELGGYHTMLEHHLNLGITAEQRFRFVSLMSLAADDASLPDDPEFRAALVGYLEWGTRLAMGNSQPGAEPVQQAPVPRWGWGVAPPYQP